MKRIDLAGAEAGLYVPLMTLNPRSEAGAIPLADLVRDIGDMGPETVSGPQKQSEPAPAVDLGPMLERIGRLEQREPLPPVTVPGEIMALPDRVAGLEQRLVELATERHVDDGPHDLPAFLQRAGAAAAPANLAAIEARLLATEQRLADALENMGRPAPRPAPPTVAMPNNIATIDDIKAIVERIGRLEARVAEMEQAANEVLVQLTRRQEPPQAAAEAPAAPLPLPAHKAQAVRSIRAAGEARRNLTAGGTADARDAIRRLASMGYDFKASRTRAIAHVSAIADAQGRQMDDVATALIESSDRIDDLLIATVALEEGAVADIMRDQCTSHAEVDAIVTQVVAAITGA